MVGVLKSWSTTASSNATADSNINYAEGQTPASINDSARSAMAAIKGFANQISAAKTTGGSANAQTLTSDTVAAISTAYAAGMIFCVKAGYTNSTTTPTFNVDGVGAKTIKKGGAQAALAASDIVAGGIYWLVYEASGDCFLLLNPESGIAAQPLDATLTAFAALTTADDRMLDFTGVDTMAVVSYATVLSNIGAQASDGDLTAIAALTTTAAGRSILAFADPNADQLLFWDDSAGAVVGVTILPFGWAISGTEIQFTETVIIAASDESTALTTGTNKATFVFPFAVTLVSVGASVNTAGTALTVDINEAGTTVLSTKITLDSGEKTSLTAATPAVISDAAIAAGAEVGIDIDAVTGTAKGLKVWLQYRRTS